MKKLNWNTIVKVKLNARGRDIYYHQFDGINERAGRMVIEPRVPDEDENGFTSMQLWHFMQLYGNYIGMAFPDIVETINFFIDDDELEDVDEQQTSV